MGAFRSHSAISSSKLYFFSIHACYRISRLITAFANQRLDIHSTNLWVVEHELIQVIYASAFSLLTAFLDPAAAVAAFLSIRAIRWLEVATRAKVFVMERRARLALPISFASVGRSRLLACFILELVSDATLEPLSCAHNRFCLLPRRSRARTIHRHPLTDSALRAI